MLWHSPMVGRSPAQAVAITLLNPPTRLMLGGVSEQNRHSQSSPRMGQHLMRSWREQLLESWGRGTKFSRARP